MTTITLATLDRQYKNNGQEAERIFRYTMTGEIAKADNVAHDKGTDCDEYQVKSARATICRGTDIRAYVDTEIATKFAYVSADFTTAYIMNKEEYIEFATKFGTKTVESAKNGGHEKIRLKRENTEMKDWLARAQSFFAPGISQILPGRGPGNLHKKFGFARCKFVQDFFTKRVDFFGVL